MSAVKYELIEPEKGQEKWEPVVHRYSAADSASNLDDISLLVHPGGQSEVVVGFNPQSGKKDVVLKSAQNLLRHAGFEGVELQDYGSNSFSFTIDGTDDESLLRVLAALSNNVDMDHGRTYFAVIDEDAAHKIAMFEMERIKLDVLVPEGQYVDIDFDRGGLGAVSAIKYIKEDGFFGSENPVTQIYLSGKENKNIETALELADLEFEKKDGVLRVIADVSAVTVSLVDAGILPRYLVDEVGQKIKNVRPNGFEAPGNEIDMRPGI